MVNGQNGRLGQPVLRPVELLLNLAEELVGIHLLDMVVETALVQTGMKLIVQTTLLAQVYI